MGKRKRSPRLLATWDHVANPSLADEALKYTMTKKFFISVVL
ncbi:hypothetical protein [Geomicrobium sp. JCM 19039]|nr:hypothetical protein [Geomicrobium sp. JCM 19039]